MRIAQVSWTALPVAGGVETHVDVSGLRADGDQVTLFTGTPDAPGALSHPALRPGGPSAAELPALVDRLMRHDVVHLHNPQWHRPETAQALQAALGGPRLLYWLGAALLLAFSLPAVVGGDRAASDQSPADKEHGHELDGHVRLGGDSRGNSAHGDAGR